VTNNQIDANTASDIDAQVHKVLRDLGNPDPPLRLEQVRELLSLAKDYYSTSDDGILKRWVHSLKLAGKQIAERPGFLLDFVKNFRIDALCLFDEKRILLSETLPSAKQRWAEGHEIGHVLIPWHGPISLGDDKYTLTADCHEQIEAEANFAARRLLFLRDRFKNEALGSEPTVQHVLNLKKTFGNTITTTFYGLIEVLDMPAFGLISDHPKRPGKDFDPDKPCRHFIRSPSFAKTFPQVTEKDLFGLAEDYCGYGKWNLGSSEVILVNGRAEPYVFRMETVFNHYDALTVGTAVRKHDIAFPVGHGLAR
jgi:Zn-dependent peptidase ImmA (M78 family)